MTIKPGSSLGPYEIVGKLGAGGMGEVYRAKDSRIGRLVAVKVLPAEIAADPERLGRFEHEARAAGMLNHPNLLTIFDVGSASGLPYMVSELLVGETLREVMDRGPVPQKKALDYGLQIAKGLAAAHEKGLIHRDLKPENIFVTADGLVKILDFGLAKLHPAFAADGPNTDGIATEPGMVLGTVGYMSPEQVRGQQLDLRSDIFSFGTILWEMLAGRRAFTGESAIETLSAILREEPPDLTSVNPSVSPLFEKIVHRCLEKKTAQRFQSARDLAFHLETIQSQIASASTSMPLVGTGASPTARLPSVERPLPSGLSQASRATGHAHRPATHATPQHGTSTSAVQQRATEARAVIQERKARKRTVWEALVACALLLILGLIGGYLYRRHVEESSVPTFDRLTFRRGEILSARFAQDGGTVVYSASWDGSPEPELFVMQTTSPESRPFGIPRGEVAAISRSGEVALLLEFDRDTRTGRLARVPLMGGQPRDVLENVLAADFLPDGNDLGVIHRVESEWRLEVPIGNVLHSSARRISALRISPDGKRIAFLQLNQGEFEIVMLESGEFEVLTSGWRAGISGIAWSPDGGEVWFTAAKTGSEPPSLYAVAPGAEPRMVSRLTGALRVHDISSSGGVLLTHSDWQSSLRFAKVVVPVTSRVSPDEGDAAGAEAEIVDPVPVVVETDLSWLDWSVLGGITADGSKVVLSETREGGGEKGSVYLRGTDGSAPVRLGDGWADDVSPDGKWVLAHESRTSLVRIPTGAGEPERLDTVAAIGEGARFFPDGDRILVPGAQPQGGFALFKQDLASGEIVPVTPEGIWSPPYPAWVISPDGTRVAAPDAARRLTIYEVAGSRSRPVVEAEPEEIPIQWGSDGRSLYVCLPGEVPLKVWRIDLEAGTRTLWRTIAPADPAGVYRINPVLLDRNGRFWAYNVLRTLSDLYVATGLE